MAWSRWYTPLELATRHNWYSSGDAFSIGLAQIDQSTIDYCVRFATAEKDGGEANFNELFKMLTVKSILVA